MQIYKNGNYYTDGNYILDVTRKGNDINGNPLYKVVPVSFLYRRLESAFRNYASASQPYYLLQSYNVVADLKAWFDEMDQKDFPKMDVLLDEYDYKPVKAFLSEK